MITFYIITSSDIAYTAIIEYLISHSLTFSKDTSSGPTVLEVEGCVADYKYFKDLIDNNQLHAQIHEVI